MRAVDEKVSHAFEHLNAPRWRAMLNDIFKGSKERGFSEHADLRCDHGRLHMQL
jgi:hypothetical protein